jgi:hypothetical protein
MRTEVATTLLEEHDSTREEAEEQQEHDPYETISSHLIELRQCIQALTSLVSGNELNALRTRSDRFLMNNYLI